MKIKKSYFASEIDIREVKGNLWLLEELTYYSKLFQIKVTLKRKFIFDGASAPYRIRGLTHVRDYKYLRAACVHDGVCRIDCNLTWKQKALLYDECLKVLGMGRYERAKAYYPIRWLGSATKDPKLLANAKMYVRVEDFK